MENKQAVIFDLDGVIVNTDISQFLAWKKIAKDLGTDFTEKNYENLKGLSREDCLHKIINWGELQLNNDEFKHWMQVKNDYYLEFVSQMDASAILPGVLELLELLSRKNIPFSLGSASKSGKIVLEHLGLTQKFTAMVDGTDVTRGKPDPEIFLLAAKKLNCPPGCCVVFEDAVAGVQAANSAGMLSVGIGDREVLTEANFNFKELTAIDEATLEMLLSENKNTCRGS